MRINSRIWDGRDPRALARELRSASADPAGIATDVAEVIERVRGGGDAAILKLGERFEGVRATSLLVDTGLLERAVDELEPGLRAAIDIASENILRVARAQLEHEAHEVELPQGHRVVISEVAVGAAGIYAPGGRAVYPSSVLMGVIPAREAGVERIVVASPPQEGGKPHPVVLAAAAIAGADEVIAAGGAQAIAALAYGTESIEPVDVIVGPGGPWVQEAKLQVSRRVGIDGYAGPSELMVLCDGSASPEWIALDLCAQAEHGADGLLVVACTDAELLGRIGACVGELAGERPSVADAPLELVEVPDLDAAAELAREIAPEHLQINCAGAAELGERMTTAGCVFIGPFGATAFGDYAAGSNHTLPTGGTGRFTGPLGPGTFTRKISRVVLDERSAAALAESVDALSGAEGFPVHGESARARAGHNGPAEQSS